MNSQKCNCSNVIVVESVSEFNFEAKQKDILLSAFSTSKQHIKNSNQFQPVTFDTLQINSGWSVNTFPNYSHPTNFIAQVNGWYLITYKICVINCSTKWATKLTINGNEIMGSASITKTLEAAADTTLVNLQKGDSIALLFWSNDSEAVIGTINSIPCPIKETTAKILITKI